MSPRARGIVALLALTALSVLVVPSTLRPSELPFERDLLDFFLPMKAVYARAFGQGEIPWWDPWTLGGTPFFASLQSQVLYPPNLVFAVVALPWSLSLSAAIHVTMAGFGALLLARELGRSWSAAMLAASAFAAGGFCLSLVNLHNQLCSLAWLPWTWLAALCFARRGGRRALMGWVLALSLAFLAGEPQLALLAALSSTALGCCEAGRPHRMLATAAGVALLVIAACAVQLVPFAELVSLSDRVSPGWSQAGKHGLLLTDVPALFLAPDASRAGPAEGYLRSLFMGSLTPLLALAALAWAGRTGRLTLLLGLLAALSILLALGATTPIGEAVVKATPFLRFPVKYFSIAALAIPLLAAAGLDALRDALLRRRANARLVELLAWALVLACAGQLVAAHRAIVPTLPFDALMAPSAVHSVLVAQTSADGPRVHAPPVTHERLLRRAERVAGGDLAGAMRERVELLEGGLPAYFGIHSTWGGAALTPRPQAHLLERGDGPLAADVLADLRAGFLVDTSARLLPLPLVPIDGGAARLYVLPASGLDMSAGHREGGAARQWLGSSECVGPAGLPAPSTYPGWNEVEPGHWRFRPRGLVALGLLSAGTWLALLGLALRPARRSAVASPGACL